MINAASIDDTQADSLKGPSNHEIEALHSSEQVVDATEQEEKRQMSNEIGSLNAAVSDSVLAVEQFLARESQSASGLASSSFFFPTAAALEAITIGESLVHGIDVKAIAESTAAALAHVNTASLKERTPDPEVDNQTKKKNEQRRKRYREKQSEIIANDSESYNSKRSRLSGGSNHDEQLTCRRLKDRERYANMTPEQRQVYNSKRREQYHRQTELSRQKRRERERSRYHALPGELAKERNIRRAKLERERYQKLTQDKLEDKNRARRERAAASRHRKELQTGTVSMPVSDAAAQNKTTTTTATTSRKRRNTPKEKKSVNDAVMASYLGHTGALSTVKKESGEEKPPAIISNSIPLEDPVVAAAHQIIDSSII